MTAPGYNAFTAAHEAWTFTDRFGEVHVAAPISAPQANRFAWRFQQAAGDIATTERLTGELVRRMFPWRMRYLWRGDPAARFMAQTPRQRAEALNAFFAQAGWLIHLQFSQSPPTSTRKPNSPAGSANSTGTRTPPLAAHSP